MEMGRENSKAISLATVHESVNHWAIASQHHLPDQPEYCNRSDEAGN